MSKTTYNIQLKGYVGGWDFDRADVDDMLAQNEGKTVNVLIDSLGGSLATGLSISAAFKQHGNVAVHFVGLNASAATIASLGAAHISIDAGAMYLVHQCSMAFFEWGSLNSDQFAALIADCEKVKADLDKLDLNVAQLYAKKCSKPYADLLALMKVGGWLSAKEALDWGFVDEITDLADEPAPKLTDKLATAMATESMPIPNIPLAETDREGLFAKFIQAISSLFRSLSQLVPTSAEANSFDSAECSQECRNVIDLTEMLSDIEVPSLVVPELDVSLLGQSGKPMMSTTKKDTDLFAEKKRAAWKDVQTEEARCDFAPNRLRITVRSGVYFISLWKKSVYGRTLTDIKGDDEMVKFFSENITALIRSVLGSFLKASDYAVVTTPRRRHKECNFATMIASEIAANLGLPFYDDCAIAHSRHRMGAIFTPNNIPREDNVIVFDDFVTSGQTLASMHRVLTEHRKNCIYFVGINNKI